MDFETTVDISARPDTVWSVISDVEHWHEWTPSIRGIRLLDQGPLRLGSRAIVRQPKFPPAMWKVTAIDPGHSFTWVSGTPGMRVHATHAVANAQNGSRARLSLQFQGVFGQLLAKLTEARTREYLGYEAAGLKRRSEEPDFRR